MFQHLTFHSPSLGPLAIIACAVMVILVPWLYRPQTSALLPAWRWIVPSLRAIALLALGVSSLRPATVRPKTPAERGTIVVLIDQSHSMSVVDRGRSASQLVALAAVLHLLPPDVAREPLEHVAAEMRSLMADLFPAHGQFDSARAAGQNIDGAEQRLTDRALQAQSLADRLSRWPRAAECAQRIGELCGDDQLSGDQWARQVNEANDAFLAAVAEAQTLADQELYRTSESVEAVCEELAGLSRAQLIQRVLISGGLLDDLLGRAPVVEFGFAQDSRPMALEDIPAASSGLTLQTTGARSDFTAALRAVRERMQGQPIQAIVMFSDGRQIGGTAELTRMLSTVSAPIFAVNSAAPIPCDASIVSLHIPGKVYVGQTTTLRAEVRANGTNGVPIRVTLGMDGQQQQRIVEVEDERIVPVEFAVTFDHPGITTLNLAIEPLLGEATVENNRVRRSIKVLPGELKVSLLTGASSQDFQALCTILSGTPLVQVHDEILTADNQCRMTPEQIVQQDVLVLSDLRFELLSREQWQAVAGLVARGGGIIVIPGEAAKNLADIAREPGIANLLPYRRPDDAAWRVWPGQQPYFRFLPSRDSQSLDALMLADDLAQSSRHWAEIGAMLRFMPAVDLKPNFRPLLIEQESGLPVLTEGEIGRGRALFFGAHETWRWQAQSGPSDQDRFWLQLIRHAAPERFAAEDGTSTFDADPPTAAPDEPIRVRARIAERTAPPTARLRSGGRIVQAKQMSLDSSGGFEVLLRDVPPGDYELCLAINGAETKTTLPLRVATDFEAEMANIAGDEGRLRRIASGTGGEMLRLEETGDLAQKIRESAEKLPGFVEYQIWDSPYLFWFIVGCLGAEWGLRKACGLV